MANYEDFVLYDTLTEDLDKVKKLELGSENWKRVQDSIDKRYNTTMAELRMFKELEEKEARMKLEQEKAEKDAELREFEATMADKKSKREFIGKLAGIGAGIAIVFGKILYDNSEAITDKFTLDAGSKMINNK